MRYERVSTMVKLRVINGGKAKEDETPAEVKLYSAYSLVDNFQGRDCVKLNWVCMERKGLAVPASKLFNGQIDIDKNMLPYFEEYVYELFTKVEVEALGSYLSESHGIELHVNEEVLPSIGFFVPMPYKSIPQKGDRGYYDVADPGLPVKVRAYFDLGKCPPSIALQQDSRKRGIMYLREALELMGMDVDARAGEIESLVEALYDKHGLYVQQGKDKVSRLKERLGSKNA
jgi:hypothetical protein